MEKLKLNVGSGEDYLEDYINIDIVDVSTEKNFIDLKAPDILANVRFLPFKGEIFDEVFMSEVIEHVERMYMIPIFDEIWRVLKPGGEFYLSFPDFIECMKGFIENRHGARWEGFFPTLFGRQAHRGDYHINPVELQDAITKLFNSGFGNLKHVTVPYDIQITCYKKKRLPTYI